MERHGVRRFYSASEVLELVTAQDGQNEERYSSDPDTADTDEEEDFIEGIDKLHDITGNIVEEKDGDLNEDDEEDNNGVVAGASRGRKRSREGPASKRRGKRSETHVDTQVKWKTEKETDHLLHPPLHFRPKRTPGVQLPLSNTEIPSPSELFKLFFDQATIKTLCENTNKNAAKNLAAGKKFCWTDVTANEMYAYIGLTLYMGLMKRPQLKDFWRTTTAFQVSYPGKVMSRDRFLNIHTNVHMSNPEDDAVNDQKKGTPDYDPLHRLRPLYDSLRVACKALYHPRKNLSVDERMVATKAKIGLKQYIKSKPTKWGIKLFVLSDTTGYTTDFHIYTGRSTQKTGKGLSFDAVMSLINKDYLGSGYHIYCDNFYTSPALFCHLHKLGFGACGTFRNSTVGVPKTTKNALTKKSPRGSIRWLREGPLIFVKWMDTREVSVCSTVHTAFKGDAVRRVGKAGGQHQVLYVPVPSAVRDYNCFMGGVDLSDQLIGSYTSWRKCKKWYKTVLHHFIDIAVTNSYLIHKEMCAQLEQKAPKHQAFQEQLTVALCGVQPQAAPTTSYRHLPVAIFEGASVEDKATKGRRKCKLCGKCTPFMCEACKLPLCVIVDRNCHKDFHSSSGHAKK
uniref:PiggyBac transposable element-derived protein domain-containing protein n=1 Tax=Xiphophorus maculatus TaxID=8083 RepID=A0A3B5R3B2_XIPMA